MPTLNLRLDDELNRRLSREAELEAQTRSEIARQAIEHFLSGRQRQRFLNEIARAARSRGPGEAVSAAAEALTTDNEALAPSEQLVSEPRTRHRAKRAKR
jgi:predicted transcriptional regulator